MHTTAYITAQHFFNTYTTVDSKVLEIGSQNVNGSLKDHCLNPSLYTGVDFCAGNGVDVVLEDPYKYPFEDNTFDIIVTSSCFEHSEMFWLSYLECLRVLKPSGILYCNAPGNRMPYHRYPVDCWRFMPDAAKGLETWGNYNGIPVKVLETFTVVPLPESDCPCFDWCGIFIKDKAFMHLYTKKMVDSLILSTINIFKFVDGNDNNWAYMINPDGAH